MQTFDINDDQATDLTRDYAYYCESKIINNEMPLSFREWQRVVNNNQS